MMKNKQAHIDIIQKLYSMGVQEHSKFTLSEILHQQNPDLSTAKYLLAFHKELWELLDQEDPQWFARTHHKGLTYMCNERKAFIYLNLNKSNLSMLFFTGNQEIKGLKKGNWSTGADNVGCQRFRVTDDLTFKLAVKFAIASFEIAKDWDTIR